MKKNVKINTIYNAIKSCITIIFPLITFPYISRVLSAENIGKINFGLSIVSYFSLIASLGISTYGIRECSKVKNDRKLFSALASEIYSINIYSTIIAYGVLVFTLLVAKPLHNYKSLILLQSLTIGFTTIGADWLNNIEEDFKFITIRTVAFNVLSIVLMFMFVKETTDYVKYALISVVASAGGNIVNYRYRMRFCDVRFVLKPRFSVHLKPIILMFSLLLVQTIYVNSDVTILGLIRTDYEVGLYSAAVKVYNLIQTLMNSVVLVVLPQLTMSYAKKDYTKVNELLRYAMNFTLGLGLPCLVGVNAVGAEVITLFAGEEYLECLMALRILTVALFWSFLGGILGNLIMIPSGREKISLISSVLSAVVNFVLNLVLIPRWGIEAAAFTTALSMFIGFVVKLPFVEKEINIFPIKNIVIGPVVGCAMIALIGQVCAVFIENYIIKLVMVIGISVPTYFLALILCKNELAMDMFGSMKKIFRFSR